MKKEIICIIAALFVQGSVAEEEMRTWTSRKGDVIAAKYVRMFAGGKVVLRTSKGRDLKIPVTDLSKADQKYLAELVPPKLDISVDMDIDVLAFRQPGEGLEDRDIPARSAGPNRHLAANLEIIVKAVAQRDGPIRNHEGVGRIG